MRSSSSEQSLSIEPADTGRQAGRTAQLLAPPSRFLSYGVLLPPGVSSFYIIRGRMTELLLLSCCSALPAPRRSSPHCLPACLPPPGWVGWCTYHHIDKIKRYAWLAAHRWAARCRFELPRPTPPALRQPAELPSFARHSQHHDNDTVPGGPADWLGRTRTFVAYAFLLARRDRKTAHHTNGGGDKSATCEAWMGGWERGLLPLTVVSDLDGVDVEQALLVGDEAEVDHVHSCSNKKNQTGGQAR